MEPRQRQDPRDRLEQLKVDCTAFNLRKDIYLVQYNVNLPRPIVLNLDERQNALERVRALLILEFGSLPIEFQITGTYVLKNSETGEERNWHGSFYTGLNNPSVVSDFQLFDRRTFVNTVFQSLNTAEAKFIDHGRGSKWKFEYLHSIILNL